MNTKDFGRYKKLLLAKQEELSVTRDEAASLVPSASDSGGDLMDSASADAEAELQISLRRTDGRLLKAIEDALARIRAGTFGVCETCRSTISTARLEAVPWTRLCRECKEKQSP